MLEFLLTFSAIFALFAGVGVVFAQQRRVFLDSQTAQGLAASDAFFSKIERIQSGWKSEKFESTGMLSSMTEKAFNAERKKEEFESTTLHPSQKPVTVGEASQPCDANAVLRKSQIEVGSETVFDLQTCTDSLGYDLETAKFGKIAEKSHGSDFSHFKNIKHTEQFSSVYTYRAGFAYQRRIKFDAKSYNTSRNNPKIHSAFLSGHPDFRSRLNFNRDCLMNYAAAQGCSWASTGGNTVLLFRATMALSSLAQEASCVAEMIATEKFTCPIFKNIQKQLYLMTERAAKAAISKSMTFETQQEIALRSVFPQPLY